ncbi:GIY-YIG catalytic domain-containing endonuclease [Paramecium bursaria Chlorella virus OR0704.2.2]|nr:GIY-YIG catalytic domain-containing endonuclease [Paramecium bursaria Chlorella virus CZ-2]AGE58953.1 GIY-YIG catalytic domain-containing endonuclease [Paramecium bursaria Chlorella virus OR0704.2.2]
MGFIYMLTFPSEKSYIGQTIRDIHKRLEEHQYASSGCVAVCNAIQKYGWEKVKIDWYEVPDEDLNKHEELMVEVLGTLSPGGYNLREGGGSTGKMSEETKQKIREVNLGKTLSEEAKQKLSDANSGEENPMFGKNHTEESKQKMKEAKTGEKCYMFGKEHTEETKQKMKKAQSGDKNHNSKKVYQYTLDGMYVDDFASSGEAAQALGKTDGSNISMCARGKRPTAYGFKWSREKL